MRGKIAGTAVLTVEHDRADAEAVPHNVPDIASFFFQLTHGAHFGRLVGVNQARGDFDDGGIDGRTPLLLQQNAGGLVGLGGVLQDGDDAHSINVAAFGAGEALGGFPLPLLALGVGVGDPFRGLQHVKMRSMWGGGVYFVSVAHLAFSLPFSDVRMSDVCFGAHGWMTDQRLDLDHVWLVCLHDVLCRRYYTDSKPWVIRVVRVCEVAVRLQLVWLNAASAWANEEQALHAAKVACARACNDSGLHLASSTIGHRLATVVQPS